MSGTKQRPATQDGRRTVAAVVTEYRYMAHAQNIVNKLLEGYLLHWVHVPPRVRVASLFMDQTPEDDIGREMAAKHGVPLFPTIKDALTLGGASLAVDGVVLLGEHGNYPLNEKGQRQYPRRRFFEETVEVFRQSGRVVPIFNDKHLAYNWEDAKWIYDTATSMKIPMMAGSSMPLSFRAPPLEVPLGAPVEEIVVVADGGLESYGYHALEIAQCLADRRRGHETGVAAVQCLTGNVFWDAVDAGDRWSRALQDAALAAVGHLPGTLREVWDAGAAGTAGTAGTPSARNDAPRLAAQPQPWLRHTGAPQRPPGATPPPEGGGRREWAAFLIEYLDGLRVTVLMIGGYVMRRGVALRIAGQDQPWATWFLQQRTRNQLWHFDAQVDHIERMVETGRAPYPLERTLLTIGLIDAIMSSRHMGGERLKTPHLAIRYEPAEASIRLSAFTY
ncbi:MAG TPA: hypothetical protein VNM48_07620 [Chloroflexota bacterium]|nr:hypothetical protein [Chloroflexota bacterium]